MPKLLRTHSRTHDSANVCLCTHARTLTRAHVLAPTRSHARTHAIKRTRVPPRTNNAITRLHRASRYAASAQTCFATARAAFSARTLSTAALASRIERLRSFSSSECLCAAHCAVTKEVALTHAGAGCCGRRAPALALRSSGQR
eukprot:6186457-Pleurochrysis_carterae.AAC.1